MIPSSEPSQWPRSRLASEYAGALRAYLAGGGEAALSRAYDLGRAAVASGVGVVELALVHAAALQHITAPLTDAEGKAATFLAESLSPFEMTHRGFQESAARLQTLNLTLERKNEELQATTRRLREAKEAAEAANAELEAFSYSVSHDLRAPLRSIDGFSLALLEDDGDVLSESGREHVERVRAAARRMGQLIDDLLTLSRVSRAELVRRSVDVSAIARLVLDEIRGREPDPDAVVDIEPGMTAEADGRLLHIVLENLLGNAWKFTSKSSGRRIRLGTEQQGDETVYVVRDNGAGFDMRHVQRLFSPFQRLHSESEFAGTGIGLATVRRVVARHGGRVWAEGAVGKGAAVFFTLAPARAMSV